MQRKTASSLVTTEKYLLPRFESTNHVWHATKNGFSFMNGLVTNSLARFINLSKRERILSFFYSFFFFCSICLLRDFCPLFNDSKESKTFCETIFFPKHVRRRFVWIKNSMSKFYDFLWMDCIFMNEEWTQRVKCWIIIMCLKLKGKI